jgi:hypothetical protein
MNVFNVESFLKGLDEDAVPNRGLEGGINKILMNTKDNQGTIEIIPFLNKKTNNFYLILSDVKEWNGHTTKLKFDSVWYKVLPDEYYENLSPENQTMLTEINGLFESIKGYDEVDFNTLRVRNYTLIYGVLRSHINIDDKKITDNVDKPCLFIFPSFSPVNAIKIAISAQCQVLGSKNWITGILNPENTGRKGVMTITFKKTSTPGYATTVGFNFNNKDLGSSLVDPTRVFDDNITKHFDDPIKDLLGWQSDGEGGYFNVDVMRELRDDLKLELKRLGSDSEPIKPEQVYENKNGNIDPMKSASPVTESVVENKKSTDLPF